MAAKQLAILTSIEALIAHCENVEHLKIHVHRCKTYVREREAKAPVLTAAKIRASQGKVINNRQCRGIAI